MPKGIFIDTLNQTGIPPSKIMSMLSKEIIMLDVFRLIFKIIWVIKEESCFKMEMPRECINILLSINVKIQVLFMQLKLMKMGAWVIAFGQMLGQELHTNILEMSLFLMLHTKQILIRCLLFLSQGLTTIINL